MRVSLPFKVRAGSGSNRVVGLMSDGKTIKLEINAPPEREKANRAIVAFLANLLDIPAARIAITHGRTSPHKIISFEGVSNSAGIIDLLTGRGV